MIEQTKRAITIKADFQPVFRLLIHDTDKFLPLLTEHIAQAPSLFKRANVILEPQQPIDLHNLVESCRQLELMPCAVVSDDKNIQQQAEQLGLRITTPGSAKQPPPKTNAAKRLSYQVIQRPVRSGQQIYARNQHLVVMNQVSAGAEIMADGDIHVYGPLRGRAMAGVLGDQQAQIFCQQLDAELLSVAGVYVVRDDMPDHHGSAQVSLIDDQIVIKPLA